MPKSRHRRKKPTARISAAVDLAQVPAPDRIDAFAAKFANRPAALEAVTARAQEAVFDAYEASSASRRSRLALLAVGISPVCADAYDLLARHAKDDATKLEILSRGVRAGELYLGAEFFEQEAGNFWLILETRGYMRVRAQLAILLEDRGQHDAAIAHFRDLLRLNPNDNQGNRYILANIYLRLGRDDELTDLFAKYPDDTAAEFAFTRALLLYRMRGDTPESRAVLESACVENGYVRDMLLARIGFARPSYPAIAMGSPEEALTVAAETAPAWHNTPGAIEWLNAVGAAAAAAAREEYETRRTRFLRS